MDGFIEFAKTWYWLFVLLSFPLGAGLCGFFIDHNSNVIEIDQKKKEMLEKSRDMSIIRTQFKDKTLALSGLEDKSMINSGDAGAEATGADVTGTEEDLSVPLNINL